MNYGDALPLDKEIEATQAFTQKQIGEMLIKRVVDSQPYYHGTWGGHVSMSVEGGRYGFTVWVRKEPAAAKAREEAA